jgi:hypothetical protein
MKRILKLFVFLLASIALPVLAGGDTAVINLSLQNTGVDPDATCVVEINLSAQRSTMKLTLAKLTPGVAYTVTNGATPEAEFIADSKGAARLRFTTKLKKGFLLMDFEPRGQVLAVRTGGVNILQAVISAEGEPRDSSVTEYVEIMASGVGGKAIARFRSQPTGQRAFSVQLSQVSGTGWSLYVDGIWRGEFISNGSGAKIDFDTVPPYVSTQLLDFDPRGRMLDIVQGKNIVFSGRMAAQAAGVNVAIYEWRNGSIPSTGLDSDGSARVKLVVEPDARRKFYLWLMDVPEGEYEFVVNGTPAAIIQAVVTDDGVVGAVEFSSRNDDSDELPLTFDPANAVFTLQNDGMVYFTGRLAIESGGKATGGDLDSIKEDLVPAGFGSNAKGSAKFKIRDHGGAEFTVEIKKTPLGTFKVWAGGIERGSIDVKLTETESDGNGSYGYGKKPEMVVMGSITFKTGSKKHPLDFDPRGLLIEVGNSSRIYFSQIFGAGRGDAQPVISRLPLFSVSGSPNVVAQMEFKRDEQGFRSFGVGIENAPPGTYELFIGEERRATIGVVVTAIGSRGRIEFDDMPQPGQTLLDFDPRGEIISLVREGALGFQRVMPAGL